MHQLTIVRLPETVYTTSIIVEGQSMIALIIALMIALVVSGCTAPSAAHAQTQQDFSALGARLERLRTRWHVPGKTPVDYPDYFVTAAGLVSTVGDVLRFSMALD